MITQMCVLTYLFIITSSVHSQGCIIENKLATVDILIPANDPLYDDIRKDDQFASYRGTLQERDQTFQPTLITYPKNEEQIQTIVNFASDCNYKIAVRSGGHQYSGLSSCNRLNGKCIQIDMKYFDHVVYNKDDGEDPELITSITVGTGTRLEDMSVSNAANGVAIIHGACGNVGAGGHYQSSSHGVWSRSLGFGMDWIFRIKLVTADGQIRNVYKDGYSEEDNELFWAILGGSPGSWGVVIEYEFLPIYDRDYPYSGYYSYGQIYSDEYYEELFLMAVDLLDNPYYKMASDMTVYSVVKQNQTDPDDAATHTGHYVVNAFSWSGNKYGDIHNIIPNHPENKSWYQELIQPFKQLSDKYPEGKLEVFEADHLPISLVLSDVADDDVIDVPPFRYYNAHSAYKQDVMDATIFSNDTLKYQWVKSVTDEIAKLTKNSTDNVELLFQIQYLVPSEDDYTMSGDMVIHLDPMRNSVSMPTRDIPFQIDSWVLFGNNEEGMKKADKAKQAAQDLKDALNSNQNEYIINSFGYTDRSYEEYQIDQEFEYFFPERLDVFEKLKEIKTRIDCKNIFDGAITIPTNGGCVDVRY